MGDPMQDCVDIDDLVDLSEVPLEGEQKVNTQLYKNSPFPGSAIEEEALKGENALFGARMPNFAIIHEKPEHRLVLLMKLDGYSNNEIAKKMEMTPSWVSQVTRQPWFQKRLMAALHEAGRETIGAFIQAEAENSILKLVELRDTAVSEQVQATCARDILDRAFGKPVQRTEVKMEVKKTEERVGEIEEELKRLEAAEKELVNPLLPR